MIYFRNWIWIQFLCSFQSKPGFLIDCRSRSHDLPKRNGFMPPPPSRTIAARKDICVAVERTLEVSPAVVWVENHYGCSSSSGDNASSSSSAVAISAAGGTFKESSKSNLACLDCEEFIDDDEEEDGHGLEVEGEWTLLPDGTKQGRKKESLLDRAVHKGSGLHNSCSKHEFTKYFYFPRA
jgi:hypothetical protein